jgi:hypothetical protein
LHELPETRASCSALTKGLRGYHILPEAEIPILHCAKKNFQVAGLTHAAALSQVPLLPEELEAQKSLFPEGKLDQDLQQVDLRERKIPGGLLMAEVPTVELFEVQLSTPSRRSSSTRASNRLMLRTPERDKHIVNVSAVEGQFYRKFKTTRHPHTNMAKAALNMMTRTAAADYHADGIHMNAVDTGWVTDEDPVQIAARKVAEHRFHPPLDIVDGAARIVDPIISRLQHRRTHLGKIPEGLSRDGLVMNELVAGLKQSLKSRNIWWCWDQEAQDFSRSFRRAAGRIFFTTPPPCCRKCRTTNCACACRTPISPQRAKAVLEGFQRLSRG